MSIINPYKLYRKGYIVKGEEYCLSQNGYDVRLGIVYEATKNLNSILTINNNGVKNNAYALTKPIYEKDKHLYYFLKKNVPYVVETIEKVIIPKNIVGMIFSRSTFNRNGIIIRGTLFDSGFKGQPSLAIYPFQSVKISKGTRIAQIIFIKADTYKMYRGQYQRKIE